MTRRNQPELQRHPRRPQTFLVVVALNLAVEVVAMAEPAKGITRHEESSAPANASPKNAAPRF
jgi:hypothetical protein